ncbi:DciA family protein, partial [Oleiphilus sp. HI0117]|uniref:DciA family protein n=2 Tax=Oleiphilus TaxID=141450 RepID=UPI0007C21B1A
SIKLFASASRFALEPCHAELSKANLACHTFKFMRQPKQQKFAPKISLKRLSAKSNNLQSLIKQAASRKSLEVLFDETLPSAFKGKFQINAFSQGRLTLTCSSAALMTKFRFSQEQVISMLNAKIHPERIEQIKIKVRPKGAFSNKAPIDTPSTPKHLSKKNAQILREEAEHTDDLKLKKILLQLARHTD